MPVSVRERVLASFFDLFGGLTDFRTKSRMDTNRVDVGDMPALIMIDGEAPTDRISPNEVRMEQEVTILLLVRDPDTYDAVGLGTLLNNYTAQVQAAVGALPHPHDLDPAVQDIVYGGVSAPYSFDPGIPQTAQEMLFTLTIWGRHLDPYTDA